MYIVALRGEDIISNGSFPIISKITEIKPQLCLHLAGMRCYFGHSTAIHAPIIIFINVG